MRLIDADELEKKAYWHGKLPDVGNPYADGVEAVDMSDIDDAPTIDPESLRTKGLWKYYRKQNIAVCTNCSFERKLDADFGTAISCPNCGALMEAWK